MTPAFDPPWNSKQLPAMPTAQGASSSTASENQASAQLQALVSKLQSDQPLSPQEVQQIISESTGTKVSSKSMHQAVKRVDQARGKFQAAKAARQKLHTSWTNYVEESIKRWKTFAEDFAKKDAKLAEDLVAARDALQEARAHLDETKELHSKQDADELKEAEVISDGEFDEDAEAMKIEAADLIQQNITSVVDSLEKIRVRPSDEVTEETSAPKKARTESGPGSRALSPFPAPGK